MNKKIEVHLRKAKEGDLWAMIDLARDYSWPGEDRNLDEALMWADKVWSFYKNNQLPRFALPTTCVFDIYQEILSSDSHLDIGRLVAILEEGVSFGFPGPALLLGDMYSGVESPPGKQHVQRDSQKALAYYVRASELGSARALVSIARYYYKGEVVARDMKMALSLCLQAFALENGRIFGNHWGLMGQIFLKGGDGILPSQRLVEICRRQDVYSLAKEFNVVEVLCQYSTAL